MSGKNKSNGVVSWAGVLIFLAVVIVFVVAVFSQ